MTDGTYTNDGWADEGTPSAVAALAAAEKIYLGGYKVTSDAANEGIYQDVTVSPGDDWVIRVIAHSDGTSVPKAILYDQTNSAEIGSLTGTNTSTRTAPDVFLFTGAAPAGCVTLRVKLVNTQASNIVYWHQVELYANLLDNPSFETGAGDPWIPSGWSNELLDAGDSVQELVTVHSGASAMKLLAGATSGEGINRNDIVTSGAGAFVAVGIWAYGNGVDRMGYTWRNGHAAPQAKSAPDYLSATPGAFWNSYKGVFRSAQTTVWSRVSKTDGNGTMFWDDVFAVALDAVSLTVTPASEANSAESGGRRVDGRDTLTQPIPAGKLKATEGWVRWKMRMRHAPADLEAFQESTLDAFLYLFGDASNYIYVAGTAANTITLGVNSAGAGAQTNTWDCTAAWTADEELLWEVRYNAASVWLIVAGVTRVTVTTAIAFGTVPATAYLGSNNSGARQGDVVFLNP